MATAPTTDQPGNPHTSGPTAAEIELSVEQKHVERVHDRLEVMRDQARAYEAEGHRRAQFGHVGGLVERDVIVYQAALWMQKLDSQEEGLVFGRLDFEDGEIRHIGRIGVRDEEYEPLTVDWRAPAAAAFYQATATDRQEVIRRRTIRCAGRAVVRLDDDLLAPELADGLTVVGDGALMAALTRKRGAVMHDIVATIQAEQDRAVRAPADGATLITGGPGTGKTAVALHRAAYLLFNERRRFEAGGVLIVGPSNVFISYIEQVLPSLGEQTAALRSLGGLVDGIRATRHDRADLAAVKGSLELLPVLARAVRATPADTPREFRATYHGNVLRFDGRQLDVLRRRALERNQFPNAARSNAATLLVEAAWEQLPQDLRERRRTERTIFDRELRDRTEFELFVEQWWPHRSPAEVLRSCADPAELAAYGRGHLSREQVDALARSFAEPDFSVEDVPLLDELAQLLGNAPVAELEEEDPFAGTGVTEVSSWADRLGGAARPERVRVSYAHVIVDEAQDLSPMQWRVLGRLGRRASWTIVGDPVQSSWPDPAESAAALEEALGDRARHRYVLHTNYRNSAEIYEYAAQYAKRDMPELELPRAVRETGFPPEHVTDLAAAVRAALAEVEGTVGVVTALAAREEVAALLAEAGGTGIAGTGIAGIGLNGTADSSLLDERRLSVISALDAKGLEFDAAVVVDPERIISESPAGTRTLYVALTRATQRLYVCEK